MGVAVGAGVGVTVGVAVGVGVCVGVGVTVAVGVALGVAVHHGVSVAVGVGVKEASLRLGAVTGRAIRRIARGPNQSKPLSRIIDSPFEAAADAPEPSQWRGRRGVEERTRGKTRLQTHHLLEPMRLR